MSALPTGIVFLGELTAAGAVSDTDTTFWCDASGGCTVGTDLKRVSAAQLATYVAGKLNGGGGGGSGTITGVLAGANLTGGGTTGTVTLAVAASPNFIGVPQAPTAAPGTNTQQLATTAFVTAAVTGGTAGVASFNTRTGAVTLTSSDVTTALTFTPAPINSPIDGGVY